MKFDGSLARNIDFEVANFQVLRKIRRKTSKSYKVSKLEEISDEMLVLTLPRVSSQAHSTLHTLNFPLHAPDSTLYTPHSALYSPHFALYTLRSTLHTPHFTLDTPHFTLHTLHSRLYTPHSKINTPPSSIFRSLRCTGMVTGEKCTRLFK